MNFTLNDPVKILVDGMPQEVYDIELPDELNVGLGRSIRSNPQTQLFAFAGEFLQRSKALTPAAAGQVTGADSVRIVQYFTERFQACETSVKPPEKDAYKIARLKMVNADFQSDMVEWAAQVLQHVGQVAIETINKMPVGELLTLAEGMVENAFLPKTRS